MNIFTIGNRVVCLKCAVWWISKYFLSNRIPKINQTAQPASHRASFQFCCIQGTSRSPEPPPKYQSRTPNRWIWRDSHQRKIYQYWLRRLPGSILVFCGRCQRHWSKAVALDNLLFSIDTSFLGNKIKDRLEARKSHTIWATTWQNQQNGLCVLRMLRWAWAFAQSDQSSLSAWRNIESLATQWAQSEDPDQTGRMPRMIWVFAGHKGYFVGFVMRRLIWVHQTRFLFIIGPLLFSG